MSIRRPLIAGNWKMHKTAREAVPLAREVRDGAKGALASRDVVLAPPFTSIPVVADLLRGSGLGLAAQNMHHENEGAFTGEISPAMLKDAGCTHVILGHSERRQLFGETDEGVAKKTVTALAHGLVPIVCVGETLAERESSRTMELVERQIERALRALSPDQVAALVVAYEPVWAIGTGKVATPDQAEEVHAFIRKLVDRSHGSPTARALRILYGGSVKPDNVAALMSQPDLDGALVGGACLQSASFLEIIHYDRR